jgi:hypothetical protein
MVNIDYFISILLPVIATAGVYALWRTLLWTWDAAMYRWTSTLQLSTENSVQWEWLESYVRTSLLQKANHWVVPTTRATRPEPGNVPIPMRLTFEGKVIRLRIATVEPSKMIIHQYRDSTERRVAILWTRHVDGAYWHRFLQFIKREHRLNVNDTFQVRTPYFSNGNAFLSYGRQTRRRALDTLTLDEALVSDVLQDLANFRSPAYKRFSTQHGVPYRRGWLLEGPPGNGKSSLITAVATHLGTDVGMVSLNSKDLDDTGLRNLMEGSADPTDPPLLLVLEDVDCLFAQRDTKEGTTRVTFSGLLNALDGVGAAENAIVIMTTNHPEKLDPALIRPGRVDRRFVFSDPDNARIAAHYLKFFPKETRLSEATLAFVEHCRASAEAEGRACSMAHVQEQVLREVNRAKAWDIE